MEKSIKRPALLLCLALVLAGALACGPGAARQPTTVSEKATVKATPTPVPSVTPTPPPLAETPSATPSLTAPPPTPTTTPSLPPPSAPPAQPLLAWTVAADGAVFVLDARRSVYQLAPDDLTPLAQSSPLFEAVDDEPAYLLADEAFLFVGSKAIEQTIVLNRGDFGQATMLDRAGPMTLDPGQRLFMISQTAVWAYDLTDLSQPPVEVVPAPTPGVAGSYPQDLVADPAGRQLYVRFYNKFGSPPHNREVYHTYHLDTLTKVGEFGLWLGTLSRPAVAGRAGLIVATLHPKSGFLGNTLTIFDRQGQELESYTPLDGLPATDAAGDWIYLRRRGGLWVLRGSDLSLQSILPFTEAPPTDLALSPDGERLYLLGNSWLTTLTTAKVQALSIPPVSPFPAGWTFADPRDPFSDPLLVRFYPSPEMDEDGVAFAQVVEGGVGWRGLTRETFRTTDGGRSWRLLLELAYPNFRYVGSLSLSPDFADDLVLTAYGWTILRSTNRGDTWAEWTPRIAFSSDRNGDREIYTMDQEGSDLRRLTDNPAAEENPAWSPAWTRLAFQSDRHGNWDILTVKSTCDPRQPETSDICDVQQLTDDPADDILPAWSPDGRSIAFVSTRDGNPEVYVMDSDGQNPRRLTFNPTGDWRPAWLPDSQRLAFTSDRGGDNDIYLLTVPPPDAAPPTSELELTLIVTSPADDRDPAVSSQYKLLFLSDRDGIMKAYTLDNWEYSHYQPRALADTDQPEAHPGWVDIGAGYPIALVAVEQDGVSNIYRVEGSRYTPLAPSPYFDGHPAWGPAWWMPEASASAKWVEGGE